MLSRVRMAVSCSGVVNLTGTGSINAYSYNPGCNGCYIVGGTLTVDGGKVLTNASTGNFSVLGWGTFGSSTLALANGSSIVNNGTWTLGSGNVSLGAGTAAATGFSNTGTLQTQTQP